MEIIKNVTPSLHPAVIESINGYNDDTAGFVATATNAFKKAYKSVGAVHEARIKAAKNDAWTKSQQVLSTIDLADKYMEQSAKGFDLAIRDLEKKAAFMETELSQPIEQQAMGSAFNAEIRNHVKLLKEEDRRTLLNDAINSGDKKTASAILGAPHYLSGLSKLEVGDYTRRYHEKENATVFNRLNVVKRALEVVTTNSCLIFVQFEKAIGAKREMIEQFKNAQDETQRAFILKTFDE